MESLKDKKLTTSEYRVVYCEEYLKEAVLEFEDFLTNFINKCKLIQEEDNEIHIKIIGSYEAILEHHKKVFGDLKDE